MQADCPFCTLTDTDIESQDDFIAVIRDRFPVAPGHRLVITKRHVSDHFDATPWEQQAIWQAVGKLKAQLDARGGRKPDGYNVGFNAGRAAGTDGDAPARPHDPPIRWRHTRPPRRRPGRHPGQA